MNLAHDLSLVPVGVEIRCVNEFPPPRFMSHRLSELPDL